MTESNEEKEKRESAIKDQKEVQYYMALVTAWINTKMEHDKTIITLSAAAVGLLITLLTTKGIEKSWHIWLFATSFGGYAVAIFTAIWIFQQNSAYIELELGKEKDSSKNKQHEQHEHKLKRLDVVALFSFIIGTLAFISIGLITASSKLNEKNKAKSSTIQSEKNSLYGLDKIAPIQPDGVLPLNRLIDQPIRI